MQSISKILNCITDIAPLSLQENYDNAGLLVGDANNLVERALITFDVTDDVIEEAIAKSCKLIISHHPIIFKGLKHLRPENTTERIIIKAIKNDIAIACMHTNLDNSFWGVNHILGEKLGLKNLKIIEPTTTRLLKLITYCPLSHAQNVRNAMFEAGAGSIGNYNSCSFNVNGEGSFKAQEGTHPFVGKINELHFEEETRIETIVPEYRLDQVLRALLTAHPYEEPAYDIFALENKFERAGSGMIGELEKGISEKEFLHHLQQITQTPCLRHSALSGKIIQRVAICGGAGAFLIEKAKKLNADAFVTGDIKYHDFFEADNKILFVDAGHYETEQFMKELIGEIIRKKFPTFAALISESNTNPVHYYEK